MLNALMEFLGGSTPVVLNGFSLVRCPISDTDTDDTLKNYYLCLSRHELFLVPRPSSQSSAGKVVLSAEDGRKTLVFQYRAIRKIVKDSGDFEAAEIRFANGTLRRFKDTALANYPSAILPVQAVQPVNSKQPAPLVKTIASLKLYCAEREPLLADLLVSIKASHMFLTFEVHTEELEEWGTVARPSSLAKLPIVKEADAFLAKVEKSDQKRKVESLQGYIFLRPMEFLETSKPGATKRMFEKPFKYRAGQYDVGKAGASAGANAHRPMDGSYLTIEQMEPTGERPISVQTMCERAIREICSQVGDWRLRGSRPGGGYSKRMNLTGDPASWTCWVMKIRTLKAKTSTVSNTMFEDDMVSSTSSLDTRKFEFRHVTVIAARRSFIPPTMQSYRDFVVTHLGQYQDFTDDEDELAEFITDTLSPQSKGFDRDELVIQATVDALLLDAPAYSWYESELRVRPRCHEKARQFCRALFNYLLENSTIWNNVQRARMETVVKEWDTQYLGALSSGGGNAAPAAASIVGKSTRLKKIFTAEDMPGGLLATSSADQLSIEIAQHTEDDSRSARFLQIAEQIETDAPGLDLENQTNQRDWNSWRVRVWSYLAYCVDGAMYKDALDLDKLTKAWQTTPDKSVKKTLQHVLNKLLHLRMAGDRHENVELYEKANNERLMFNCEFNERVLVRLLRTGYVRANLSISALTDAGRSIYPRFLVRLLCRADEAEARQGNNSGTDQDALSSRNDGLSSASTFVTDSADMLTHEVLKCLMEQSNGTMVTSSASITANTSASTGNASGSSGLGGLRLANAAAAAMGIGSSGASAASTPPKSSFLSGDDQAQDVALNILVPALIRIFMNHPEDDKLRTYVVAILVNYSRNNYSVKANIVAGGFAREIVKLLKSKDDNLVRHACSLLINLTKTTDFRTTICRGNTRAALLELIRKNTILPDHDQFRSPKILALACQVIGNLAIDAEIRVQLSETERPETQSDADGHFQISSMVRTLADLVIKDDVSHAFKKTLQIELDEVKASALFALKNMSISSESSSGDGGLMGAKAVQKRIMVAGGVSNAPAVVSGGAGDVIKSRISAKSSLGRYASKDLLGILKDPKTKDHQLIDYLLRLIFSLCWDSKIASKLQSEKIQEGLALRKLEFANLCLQIRAKIDSHQGRIKPSEEFVDAPAGPVSGGILKSSRGGAAAAAAATAEVVAGGGVAAR